MKEIIAILISSICITSSEPILLPMNATAYCDTGYTASGEYTREGICATGIPHLMGNQAVIYQRLPSGEKGKYIGTYDILDTGCKKSVIDVWQPSLSECQSFMDLVYEDECKGKIFVEIRRSE